MATIELDELAGKSELEVGFDGASGALAPMGDVLDGLIRVETIDLVREAVGCLPGDEQEIVAMYFGLPVDGFPVHDQPMRVSEIAEVTGRRRRDVHHLLATGVAKVRDNLVARGYEEDV